MRVTLLSWNIKTGCDRGPLKNGWPRRKHALKAVLASETGAGRFDILSIQEGLFGQLEFLQDCLPAYGRCGVGRTDGVAAGEYCAIFFARKRFELTASGTFWLSSTPEKPSRSFDPRPLPPRICSWAVLADKKSNETFRVFNTHFPLAASARKKSAYVLVEQMEKIHSSRPAILSGDFNSRPGSVPRRVIESSGWINAETCAELDGAARTWHVRGRGMVCLDAIYAGPEWKVKDYRLVRTEAGGVHPSDHFGLVAELGLKV